MATMNASTTDRRTVAGVFDGPNHAETALNQLKAAGFSPEQVSVVARDQGEAKEMVESTGMGSGTATGAVTGGVHDEQDPALADVLLVAPRGTLGDPSLVDRHFA